MALCERGHELYRRKAHECRTCEEEDWEAKQIARAAQDVPTGDMVMIEASTGRRIVFGRPPRGRKRR